MGTRIHHVKRAYQISLTKLYDIKCLRILIDKSCSDAMSSCVIANPKIVWFQEFHMRQQVTFTSSNMRTPSPCGSGLP